MAARIYCPRCEWVPGAHDRWVCSPGCRMVWNTFETRARCPGCQKQWRVTVCPACHAGSPHDDWYHDENSDEATDADEQEFTTERDEELAGAGARSA